MLVGRKGSWLAVLRRLMLFRSIAKIIIIMCKVTGGEFPPPEEGTKRDL